MKTSDLKYWLKKTLNDFGWAWEPGFVEGYPEGLIGEALEQVAAERLGSKIKQVRYRHLSGWKHSGAFKIVVTGRFGRSFSCIFKNAVFSKGHIAALEGLPISPGPPEYLIYKHAGSTLHRYLPEIYMCREITPSEQYQFLMEDLGVSYSDPEDRENRLLTVCQCLPQIHDDLKSSLDSDARSRLLQYDHVFSERLLHYASHNLERLRTRNKIGQLERLMVSWDHISEVYGAAMSELYSQDPMRPIHGDCNITNVIFRRTGSRNFKLIDWEWAGLGIPHCDLVSLLKGASPDVEQEAIRIYSVTSGARTVAQDRYIYEWCKLQRGLFDAAFFARQILDSDLPPKTPLEGHIERALARADGSYRELQGLRPR